MRAPTAFAASAPAPQAPQTRRSPIEKLGVPTPDVHAVPGPEPKVDDPQLGPSEAWAHTPQGRLSLGLDVEVYHRFLWRGIYYSANPVLQPSAWLRARGLEVSVWANVMLGRELGPRLSLVTPAVGYQATWARGDYGAGLLFYLETSPKVVPPTSGEAYVTASVAEGHLALRTSHYVHYLGAFGAYYGEVGPEYDRDAGAWSYHGALVLSWASDAYNSFYFDVDEAAINAATLTLRTTRTFAEWLWVSVQLEGTTLLHGPLATGTNTYVGTAGLAFGVSR